MGIGRRQRTQTVRQECRTLRGKESARQRRGISVPLLQERRAFSPSIPWQRCQFHLQQNARACVPRLELRSVVAADTRTIFNGSAFAGAQARQNPHFSCRSAGTVRRAPLLLRVAAFGAVRAALRVVCLRLTSLRSVDPDFASRRLPVPHLRFDSLRLRGQIPATSRDEAVGEMRVKRTIYGIKIA